MDKFQKVAVHGFIKKGSKFLVTKRSPSNDYKPNEYDLPGGTVEFGEEPIKALKRELKEETGLKIKIGKPLFICSKSQVLRHQFWVVFECEYQSGEVKLDDEHDKYLWVDKNQVKSLKKIYFLDLFCKELINK